MSSAITPSKLVLALVFSLIAIAVYMAATFFIDSARDGSLVVMGYGVLFVLVATMLFDSAIEGLTTRIGMDGVDQLSLLHKGRFMATRRIVWTEMTGVSCKGHVVEVTNSDTTIRINLAYYNDMGEVVNFIVNQGGRKGVISSSSL